MPAWSGPGLDPAIPAAVVERGLRQEARGPPSAPWAALPAETARIGIRSRAVIIIGEVVRSATDLSALNLIMAGAGSAEGWDEAWLHRAAPAADRPKLPEPLQGFRIGVTSDRPFGDLDAALERRGAEVLHAPALRIAANESDQDALVEDTRRLIEANPEIVLITTGYGMHRWLEVADTAGLGAELITALERAQVLARGPKAPGRGPGRVRGLDEARLAEPSGGSGETGRGRPGWLGEAATTASLVDAVINSAAARRRVDQAVQQLGFVPNALARSLIRARHALDVRKPSRFAPRLTTVGYLSVDYTVLVGVLPERGDRLAAQSIEKSLGGPAANVAVIAANLGEKFDTTVELVTAIGDDPDSDWALAELAAKRVETVGIQRRPGQRLSRCVVLVEANGSRTIVNEPFDLEESDLQRYVERAPDRSRRHCLHLEGYQLDRMHRSAMNLRQAGWLTSLQSTGLPKQHLNAVGLRRLAGGFDVLFVNEETAAAMVGTEGDLLGRFAKELEGHRHGIVVLTLGARGAAVFPGDRGEPVLIPTPSVEVVDRTGAGDAFIGAFLAVWLNTGDAIVAARYGCVAGALAVTVTGAQGLLPDADAIEGFLPDQAQAAAGSLASVAT